MSRLSRSVLRAALACLLTLPSIALQAQITGGGLYTGSFKPGGAADVYMYFSNGATEAHDLVLTIEPDKGLHFTSIGFKSPGLTCTPTVSGVACTLDTLASHSSFNVQAFFSGDSGLTADLVTGFTVHLMQGNALVYGQWLPVLVAGPIDGAVAIAPPPALIAGASATMDVTITNNGPTTLYDPTVVVKAEFGNPIRWGYGSSEVSSRCDEDGQSLQCGFSMRLAPGESKKIPFDFITSPSEKGPGTFTVSVSPRNEDTQTANNSAARINMPVTWSSDVKMLAETSVNTVLIGSANPDAAIHIHSQLMGPSDTGRGTLTFDIPPSFSFQSLKSAVGSPSCTTPAVGQAGRITCTDSSALFDITVTERGVSDALVTQTASVQGETFDPQLSNNTASFSLRAVAPADAAVTMSATPAHPRTGDIVTFVVNVKNEGGGSGSVAIHHAPSAGLQFADQGSPDTSVFLSVGDTKQVQARFKVTATGGIVSDVVTVATANEQVTSNNTARADVVISQADLSVTLRADRSSAAPGERVAYTATITNRGPDRATNVVLTDVVPAGATAIGAAISGGTCSVTSGVVCRVDALDFGESATATIALNAADSVGQMHDDASVTSDAFDPITTDNSVSMPLTVVAPAPDIADLVLEMSATPAAVVAGSNVVFTLNVRNLGTATANAIEVTSVLPAALAPLSTSTPCTIADQKVRCTMTSLASGGSATFNINALVKSAGTIAASAIVTSSSDESSTANNSASTSITSTAGRTRGARH